MDFEYTEEQRLLAETLRRFLATGYNFDARTKIIASPMGWSPDVWAALAEMGILGVPFPSEHGGYGGTTIDMMVVMEALGEALVVEPYLPTIMGGQLVARAGTKAQQDAILPDLIQGKTKMAFAHTERGARYELGHVETRGDGFKLDGEKCVVIGGGAADLFVVSARVDGGITLFLVPRDARGLTVTEARGVDAHRVADVRLSGVTVGRDAVLGAVGQGLPVIEDVVDYATVLLCAEAVGAIKYAHDATLDYLKQRRQFGVPIGTFQALQHRMVDILISYEQARSIATLACVKIDSSDRAERWRIASAAKIKIADAARHVSQESVQLHGGMGMTEELKISHTFRRLTMIAQQFGDADYHLGRFALGAR